MLIELRVENHRSVRDEQVLSMEGTPTDGDVSAPREGGSSALTVAAIYGANASGKSNVLAALGFMREAVLLSHRVWQPDGGVPREPFAWGEKASQPSMFEVTFIQDGVRYEYGFVANDAGFQEEWLRAFPRGRKQVWFEREGDHFDFGEHLKGENRLVERVTRPNSLFLSAAIQNGHEQLAPVFHWFRSVRVRMAASERGQVSIAEDISRWLRVPTGQRSLFVDQEDSAHAERLEWFRELLRAADVGIVDVRVESDDRSEPASRAGLGRRNRVLLKHRAAVADAWLPLEEESHGTRRFFQLAPLVFQALLKGHLVVVDELEASFHPLLALHIVRAFNDPAKNPKSAQLIFATHDTNLLGTTLGSPSLTRSQVWLTEKDLEGATRLYPLTDYKPRKEENLERGYLQGRYGAIPFLGDITGIGKTGS